MDKKECFVDIWEDSISFSDFIEKAVPCNDSFSSQEDDKPESQDFEEMKRGTKQVIRRYKTHLDDIVCESKVNGTTVDIVGSRPIISRVLSGNPYNMYRRYKKESLQMNCNVCIDMSVPWNVSNGTIQEIGERVIATIERLELEGHSLGIIACCGGETDNFASLMGVKLKEIGMPLELTKISYPLSNPHFLRKFNFYWHCLNKEIKYMPNLGQALTYRHNNLVLSQAISEAVGTKTLYLPFTLFNGWSEDRIFDHVKKQLEEIDANVFIE